MNMGRGMFSNKPVTDIESFVQLGDGKVVTGCEWGNLLLWEVMMMMLIMMMMMMIMLKAGSVKVEIKRRDLSHCHQVMIMIVIVIMIMMMTRAPCSSS